MNRKEEYNLLLRELEELPIQLDYTMERVEARRKSKRWHRYVAIPVGSIISFLLVFTVLVNSVPVFAKSCSQIPLIKDLAKLVDFSPSLTRAVQHEYVQPIEQEQIQNDITARVEYLIVDQKQVNVFYSLDSHVYEQLEMNPDIVTLAGSKMEGYCLSSGNYNTPNGELNHITIDFTEQDVPSEMKLIMEVYNNPEEMADEEVRDEDGGKIHEITEMHKEPTIISTFKFDLSFDPKYTAMGEKIELNTPIVIEGQELIVTEVEIYPTHMRINLEDKEENTAYLTGMTYYIENEKGERFEKIAKGITASGDKDSPMMVSYRLESTFFSTSQSLNLYITDVVWLDKSKQRVKLDLVHQKAEDLPEGVTFEKAERKENGWLLTFAGKEYQENHHYGIYNGQYYDEEGNEYEYNSWSSETGYLDEVSGEYIKTPGIFYIEIPLVDYTKDIVYMVPDFSDRSHLENPVVVKIK